MQQSDGSIYTIFRLQRKRKEKRQVRPQTCLASPLDFLISNSRSLPRKDNASSLLSAKENFDLPLPSPPSSFAVHCLQAQGLPFAGYAEQLRELCAKDANCYKMPRRHQLLRRSSKLLDLNPKPLNPKEKGDKEVQAKAYSPSPLFHRPDTCCPTARLVMHVYFPL